MTAALTLKLDHSSIPMPEASTAASLIDNKVNTVRDRVLNALRCHMPLGTLFNPTLMINLLTFVKDQELIYKLAEFLLSVTERPINFEIISQLFEKTPLFTEIKENLKQSSDLNLYLKQLYEIFIDVLNETESPNLLEKALQGRIYTLRNALVSQLSPKSIVASQTQYKLKSQTETDIKKDGRSFLRTCLRIYKNFIQKKDQGKSFREVLSQNVHDLAHFVNLIGCKYLSLLYDGASPDDILKYKSMEGYNHSANIAASIMNCCLKALGYSTRLCYRTDLEPRVTFATDHTIIEVEDIKGEKWVVDPTYQQFFQDFPIPGGSKIPSETVLVMHQSEVDKKINTMMDWWKASYQHIKPYIKNGKFFLDKADSLTAKMISEMDKEGLLTSFCLSENDVTVPGGSEEWTRVSLKKIWDLRTYRTNYLDIISQEIFLGTNSDYEKLVQKIKKIHDFVQPMNIGSLISTPSAQIIKEQIDLLVGPTSLKGDLLNFLELLKKYPWKNNYLKYLEHDKRLNVNVGDNAYYCFLKKIVNPSNQLKKVIYGCSGPDVISALLSTNAQNLIFVDTTSASAKEFRNALQNVKTSNLAFMTDYEQYIKERKSLTTVSESFSTESLPDKLMLDFKLLGIALEKVQIRDLGSAVQIDFEWQYHNSVSEKRTLTYITADITDPSKYPNLLKTEVEKGFDFFVMKGAIDATRYYSKFMPYLGKYLNNKGWLMTTDRTLSMESKSLEKYLSQNNLSFELVTNQEIETFKEVISAVNWPFNINPVLSFPKEKRQIRPDGFYWTFLNLHQKI